MFKNNFNIKYSTIVIYLMLSKIKSFTKPDCIVNLELLQKNVRASDSEINTTYFNLRTFLSSLKINGVISISKHHYWIETLKSLSRYTISN